MESFSLHDDAQYLFTSCAICPHGGSIEWIWRIVRDDCISLPLPDYAWDSCLFRFFYFIVIGFFCCCRKALNPVSMRRFTDVHSLCLTMNLVVIVLYCTLI